MCVCVRASLGAGVGVSGWVSCTSPTSIPCTVSRISPRYRPTLPYISLAGSLHPRPAPHKHAERARERGGRPLSYGRAAQPQLGGAVPLG